MSDTPTPVVAEVEVEAEVETCLHCDRKIRARGLCATHYQYARRKDQLSDYPAERVYEKKWVTQFLDDVMSVYEEDGASMMEDAIFEWRLRKTGDGTTKG